MATRLALVLLASGLAGEIGTTDDVKLGGYTHTTSAATTPRTITWRDLSGTVALKEHDNDFTNQQTFNSHVWVGGPSTRLALLNTASQARVTSSSDAGQLAQYDWRSADTLRWAMQRTSTAESGSNAGSNFDFIAYNDAGTSLGSVFTVARATRVLTFVVAPAFTGVEATTRTNLGATTIGANLFTLANPGAITFPRYNADNTVSALSDTNFRTAIGLGTVATHADTEYVHTTGTETVAGAKTFSSAAVFNSTVKVQSTFTLDKVGASSSISQVLDVDVGFSGQVVYRKGGLDRFTWRNNSTAESGSNAGSDYQLFAHDDAGSSLGTVFTITRATRVWNFTVAPTFTDVSTTRSNLSLGTADSVTFAAVTVNAGILFLDRSGDSATASFITAADAGFAAQHTFRTGSTTRWAWTKTSTAESGSNAGSDLTLGAFDDAGSALGNVLSIPRATRIVGIVVGATVPNTTIGDASTTVPNTNFVNDALNRALTAALLRAA